MRTINEIFAEARELPPPERLSLAESLLQTLQPSDQAIEAAWIAEAQRRLAEYRSGAVQSVPGEDVFAEIAQRLKLE